MGLWADKALAVVRAIMGQPHAAQIRWILEQADKWRTDGTYSAAQYKTEIARRVRYLDGDMDAHALKLLQAEFPKTWETMKHQMVRFPLVQYITEKKARAFQGIGSRYLLRTSEGKEVEEDKPAGADFKKLVELSQIELTMTRIEHLVEGCRSCAGRVTWDEGEKRVRVWPYEPTKVHIVPSPTSTSDPYAAAAVAFERDGPEGPNGKPIYDVFGMLDKKIANATVDNLRVFLPTTHYTGSAETQLYAPADGANPIKDRVTQKPIYPMAWFRDHADRIYVKGSDDLVQMNALVNLGLTWLNHNVGWQLAALPIITTTGQVDLVKLDELKNKFLAHPKFLMELPSGCKLEFVAPVVDVQKFVTFFETLIQYVAMMQHMAPKSISLADGTPQSGRAIELQMVSLAEYRAQRVKIYKPQVEHLLDVMISVWNLYAPAAGVGKAIPNGLRPCWEPGRLDTGPIDAALLKEKWLPAIEINAATPDDYAAELHQVSKEQAKKIVDEAADRNAELKKKTTRYPDEMITSLDDLDENGKPKPKPEGEEAGAKPASAPASKPQAQPAKPEEKPEEDAEPAPQEGAGRLEKINVYQIAKAIQLGAATNVDMRMAVFGEDRPTAERMVAEAIKHNKQVAADIGAGQPEVGGAEPQAPEE